MKHFVQEVVDTLVSRGVDYGDVRVVRRRAEHIQVKNRVLEAWSDEETFGFGVRVLQGGYWGFASSCDVSQAGAEAVIKQALALAGAAAVVGGERARLAPLTVTHQDWASPYEEDPFSLSAEKKIELLLQATAPLAAPGVTFARGTLGAVKEEKYFASTEGALHRQDRLATGAGISAVAVRHGDVQVRSYPSAHSGTWSLAGFELVRGMRLAEEAPRVAQEAVALLAAPRCPAETTTIILDTDQTALQVHESVGHPTELDRILGSEASYAGGSFVTPADLHELRYGSEAVTITADATTPGGLGTFGFDDEGVPGGRNTLIRRGVLVGLQTSRETATGLSLPPSGGMRASNWNRTPLIRMTNINLEPGDWELDELIADTREGLLLSTNKSWSIDDRRLNFHFGTEIGWRIANGRLAGMLRDCTYSGTTPQFWGSCDAVCNERHWEVHGVTNCGKGEPGQDAQVGHGVAPARFRNVSVEPAR